MASLKSSQCCHPTLIIWCTVTALKAQKWCTQCFNSSRSARKTGIFRSCGKEFRRKECLDNWFRLQTLQNVYDTLSTMPNKDWHERRRRQKKTPIEACWIANQTRHDLGYRISKEPYTFENTLVPFASVNPDLGIRFVRRRSWRPFYLLQFQEKMQSWWRIVTRVSAKRPSKTVASRNISSLSKHTSLHWPGYCAKCW